MPLRLLAGIKAVKEGVKEGVKTAKRWLSPVRGTGPTVAEQDCQEEEKDQVESPHARVEPVHVRTCWNLKV